jgi:hypothetical protein
MSAPAKVFVVIISVNFVVVVVVVRNNVTRNKAPQIARSTLVMLNESAKSCRSPCRPSQRVCRPSSLPQTLQRHHPLSVPSKYIKSKAACKFFSGARRLAVHRISLITSCLSQALTTLSSCRFPFGIYSQAPKQAYNSKKKEVQSNIRKQGSSFSEHR